MLTLLYNKDPKNKECILTLKVLMNSGCNLYINDIISAEVLNNITKKLFINDIKYSALKTEPLNSKSNINLIISCFNKHDRKIIKERKLEKYNRIPFNKYFYNISKSDWKKDLLKIYYVKAVELHSLLVNSLKLKYLSIDRKTVDLAKQYMKEYMMSVNDSYHIACAEYNSINYFITLDSDFKALKKSKIIILKI